MVGLGSCHYTMVPAPWVLFRTRKWRLNRSESRVVPQPWTFTKHASQWRLKQRHSSQRHAASDWSYTASTYHLQNARICGDAGSFIDPLFSSGVHLAVTGGLSAAATIAASMRGDCDEQTAGSWHSKKTVESYTRFFLAVSSATKQIRKQHEPVIQGMDENGFQRAFDLFRPSMNFSRHYSRSGL